MNRSSESRPKSQNVTYVVVIHRATEPPKKFLRAASFMIVAKVGNELQSCFQRELSHDSRSGVSSKLGKRQGNIGMRLTTRTEERGVSGVIFSKFSGEATNKISRYRARGRRGKQRGERCHDDKRAPLEIVNADLSRLVEKRGRKRRGGWRRGGGKTEERSTGHYPRTFTVLLLSTLKTLARQPGELLNFRKSVE